MYYVNMCIKVIYRLWSSPQRAARVTVFMNTHSLSSPVLPQVKITTIDIFIKHAQIVHRDKYDYSRAKYYGYRIPIHIICRRHNVIFTQCPCDHLRAGNCPECAADDAEQRRHLIEQEIIAQFGTIHCGKYDYSRVVYRAANAHIDIICPAHGVFSQRANAHARGRGCLLCVNKTEAKLAGWLRERYSDVTHGTSFDECRKATTNRKFVYDFAINVNDNVDGNTIIIELDGEQHFRHISRFRNDPSVNLAIDTEKAHKLCKTGRNLIRVYQPWVERNRQEWDVLLAEYISHITRNKVRGHIFYIGGPVYDSHRTAYMTAQW